MRSRYLSQGGLRNDNCVVDGSNVAKGKTVIKSSHQGT